MIHKALVSHVYQNTTRLITYYTLKKELHLNTCIQFLRITTKEVTLKTELFKLSQIPHVFSFSILGGNCMNASAIGNLHYK